MLPPADLDGLSHADLKSLVLKLLEEVAELRRTVAAQRDEIARLKGGPGRPNIKPSGMDKATEPRPPPPTGSEPRQKGGKTSKLSIHEERTVTIAAPPQGSRFKGYTNFVVQDLVIRSHVVNFRRERWQKPDGDMMTAPLPAGISGHFGPELRRFVLAQYHQGQVTVPRLLAQLRAFGIVISKRQLVRLLIAGQDGFLAENREVLRAGLSSAAWVTVDDTGARHKAANGFCTQVGNAHFAWFGTTASKSRLNFLHLLRAGHSDYVINTEALDYMRQRALSSPVIARLAEHPQRFFTSQVAWDRSSRPPRHLGSRGQPRASASAMLRPMPDAAPVTSARLPRKSFIANPGSGRPLRRKSYHVAHDRDGEQSAEFGSPLWFRAAAARPTRQPYPRSLPQWRPTLPNGDAESVCLRARVHDRTTVCIACSAFFVISRRFRTAV